MYRNDQRTILWGTPQPNDHNSRKWKLEMQAWDRFKKAKAHSPRVVTSIATPFLFPCSGFHHHCVEIKSQAHLFPSKRLPRCGSSPLYRCRQTSLGFNVPSIIAHPQFLSNLLPLTLELSSLSPYR